MEATREGLLCTWKRARISRALAPRALFLRPAHAALMAAWQVSANLSTGESKATNARERNALIVVTSSSRAHGQCGTLLIHHYRTRSS